MEAIATVVEGPMRIQSAFTMPAPSKKKEASVTWRDVLAAPAPTAVVK
jgi:hypothetical protein